MMSSVHEKLQAIRSETDSKTGSEQAATAAGAAVSKWKPVTGMVAVDESAAKPLSFAADPDARSISPDELDDDDDEIQVVQVVKGAGAITP